MRTQSIYAEKGDGVPALRGEIKPEVLKRIERLGKMNDRRMKLTAAGDRMGLLNLADEYENLGHYGLPTMAREIRYEAMEVKQ
jgi:hypothetical protein